MLKKHQKFFVLGALYSALLLTTGVGFGIIAGSSNLHAQESLRAQINEALTNTGQRVGIDTTLQIGTVVGRIVQVFLGVLGIIFLILLVYGGFKWMEAQGEEKKVGEARALMFQAIIGLAIILGAYALTDFFVGELQKSAGF